MKKQSYFTLIILSLFIYACSDMDEVDEYKKFTDGGEISYTEKMDSIKVFSGKNRAKIQGVVNADPKITNFTVYWNSKQDSINVPVERTGGVDTLTTMIDGLAENIYNFEVRTFDNEGNKSIPVYITANVYGNRYQESISTRPLISDQLLGSNLTINFGSMDLLSGVIGTEVVYNDELGVEKEVFLPIDSTSIAIDDFLGGSSYSYRTLFLPEENAIDTFYTDYKSFTPEFVISEAPYFKNATFPFSKSAYDDSRWGTPEHWIHNDAALSHNGYGALDGDIFDFESGWGQPAINNGKVYQTFVLAPGTYAYIIDIRETNYEAIDAKDKVYFSVAEGGMLPDVNDVEISDKVLAYKRVNKEDDLHQVLMFTIDEVTQISVGVQGSLPDANVGRYLKINSFALGELSENPELVNTSVPFQASETNGRWGNLEGWIANDAMKNHDGYGGWDEWNGNIFNIESGWETPGIENGKIYQVLILKPGTYTYKANFRIVEGGIDTSHEEIEGIDDNAYLLVSKGSTLPDVSDVETSSNTLIYEKILAGKSPDDFVLTFSVDKITPVALGIVTTQPGGTVSQGREGRHANIESFEFYEN